MRPLLVALVFTPCFFMLEHDLSFAGGEAANTDGDDLLDDALHATQKRSSGRDASLAILALGGLTLAFTRGRQPWNIHPWLAFAWGAVALWIICGYPLATDKSYVIRRLAATAGIAMYAVGCARALSPKEIVRMALASFAALVCIAFVIDILGGANPVKPGYRFAGTLHPNAQGIYCAIICLASLCLMKTDRPRWLFKAGAVAGFVLLVMTKSRGSLFGLVVALLAVWIASRERRSRYQALAFAGCLVAAGLLVFACLSNSSLRSVHNTVLLERTEGAGTLSGRTLLWTELLKVYFPNRFWTGYGFGGFWTEPRIDELYHSQEWAMGNAHNAYIDMLLQLGVIGLVISIVAILSLLTVVQGYLAATRDYAYRFYFALFAFALANSTLEALFLHPTKQFAALGMVCLASAMFFRPMSDEAVSRRSLAAAFDRLRSMPSSNGRALGGGA